ncbi:MAG: SAM-dependent methyltransferase [Methanolinea sp.]|nr:SAM-dependent methyltransferase [Methanolinea sp.]
MRVREVPVRDLPLVREEDWVDPARRPFVDDGRAFVPVRDGYRFSKVLARKPRYSGRGYYMVGDIAVVHGNRPRPEEISSILEWCNPRGLLWIRSYRDPERFPVAELLAGSAGETVHRENGISYHLDPTRVMFSMGNRVEKERISAMIIPGERVADMFAGIGYFTLPAALAGARVHAMEINPEAYGYLVRNIHENRVEYRVDPVLGDCRDHLSGIYDRILMGHFSAPDLLESALDHAARGTVLHVHSEGDASTRIREVLEERGIPGGIGIHKVKKLRPHTWHCVQDVTIL